MQINSSLDWHSVHASLRSQIGRLPYNSDFTKMLNNISNMVSELSSAEVETRRINKPEYNKSKIDAINQAISHLEKLLLIAELMK
jgi:hypothetical protein